MMPVISRFWRRTRELLGLEMPAYDPQRVVQDEGAGLWYWACLYAWATMLAALLSCSAFMSNPVFIGTIGLLLAAAFPTAYYLHYSRISRLTVNYVVLLAAVVIGSLQFGPTIMLYSRQPPDSVYVALRFLIAIFLWITAFRAFSVRTVTELVHTILPTTSIVLLSLVAFPHYSTLGAMALLIMGALALLALEHRLSAEKSFDPVTRLRHSRAQRSADGVYSWPALYLLAVLTAVGVGFWAAQAELSSSVTDRVRTYLARALVQHFTARFWDYSPPPSLWLPRLDPPQGRNIVMQVVCERPTNWRTAAYHTYSSRTWSRRLPRARISRIGPEGTWEVPLEGSGISRAAVKTQLHVTPYVAFGGAIPVALYPVSIRAHRGTLFYSTDGTVAPRTYGVAGQSYTVVAHIPPTVPNTGGLAYPVNGDELAADLQLPDDLSPRIGELARQLTAGARTEFEKARAIELHLAYQYEYDLAPPRTWPKELVEGFLFDTKRGFCYHFATAMVIMCRTVGLPARLAVGFTRGEARDAVEDLYVVRGEDAHAWPEVYIKNSGWMTFEPTPAAREQDQRTFGDVWRDATASAKDRIAAVARQASAYWPAAAGVLLTLTLVLVGSRSYLGWRSNRPPATSSPREQIIWTYRRMRQLLADRGVPDRPSAPAQEFVDGIPSALGEVRQNAQDIANRYILARFSARATESSAADGALDALGRLRTGLKQKPR